MDDRGGLSDRQAAEAVMFDLRCNAACGLAMDGLRFIRRFRPISGGGWQPRRNPNRIFDAVTDVITKTSGPSDAARPQIRLR